MAGIGRGRQAQSAVIWPGFLDLMTSLVMVLMFVLSVFMIVQFALRQTINSQDDELTALNQQLAGLADSLGLEKSRNADLEARLGTLSATLAQSEARGAGLAADLKGAQDQIAAMTRDLQNQRAEAEKTLTLLAAAQAAKESLDTKLAESLSEAERQKGLLAIAQAALSDEKSLSAEGSRKLALLNAQIAALRGQLGSLQALLDASAAKDKAADVQIEALGARLNTALARVAAEEKRRAEREAADAAAAKDKVAELARYRSEFFGRLSELLAGREGVRVVGDRFVFSSEVLFQPGSADLAPEGKSQIAGVVATLNEVVGEIPPEIDWIVRVDGHTDDQPLSGTGQFADNWELSQARALAVVRYMQNDLGFAPMRLAAAGFGEYRPVATADSAEARAQNRRIELKLTER